MKKWFVIISLVLLVAVIAFAVTFEWLLQRNNEMYDAVTDPHAVQNLSNSQLLNFLNNGDAIVKGNTLTVMEFRGDPFAVPEAEKLLKDKRDYIWLTAALYLGACKDPESTPYLIKALRHTASKSDKRKVRYLREITGQDFGTNFVQWKDWWESSNRAAKFDWNSSLGPKPRLQ